MSVFSQKGLYKLKRKIEQNDLQQEIILGSTPKSLNLKRHLMIFLNSSNSSN